QVKSSANDGQGLQRQVRKSSRQQQRNKDSRAGQQQGAIELWPQFAFQENRRNADAHRAKGQTAAFEGDTDLIKLRRSVDHFELSAKSAICNLAEILTRGQDLVFQ